jgi:hypothetical protein
MILKSVTRRSTASARLVAIALASASLAGASVAVAQVNVSVGVAPEIPVGDSEAVVATTEPPDPLYEEQTDQPGPGYVWVGGYWAWTGSDWVWYPGQWQSSPAGDVYVEPYYERVGADVVFVPGYWGPPGAPRHRSYGGERIRFAAQARPADYRRGEAPRLEHRPGALPGSRPAALYQHAVGPVRPLPRAAAPGSRGPAGHDAPREAPHQAPNEPSREPTHAAPVPPQHQPPPTHAPAVQPQPERDLGRESPQGHEPAPAQPRATPPQGAPPIHEAPTPPHPAPPRASPPPAPRPGPAPGKN